MLEDARSSPAPLYVWLLSLTATMILPYRVCARLRSARVEFPRGNPTSCGICSKISCSIPTGAELQRGKNLIPVAPQVFDLLTYLIRHRERVVTKDDMVAAIWEGRAVSDLALTTRINAARVVVGDSGEGQRLIKTLLRKGVRFVGEVQEQQPAPEIRPSWSIRRLARFQPKSRRSRFYRSTI